MKSDHQLANVAQSVYFAVQSGNRADAIAELRKLITPRPVTDITVARLAAKERQFHDDETADALEALWRERNDLSEKLKMLEASVRVCGAVKDQEVDDLRAQLERAERNVDGSEQSSQSLRDTLAIADKQLSAAQARVAELEATCENLRETVSTDADKMLALETREKALRAVVQANIKTLERYAPECFPEIENGQKHFVRVLMESMAEELRQVLAGEKTPLLWPETLTEDLEWILGRPCFTVAKIARRLHELGLYKVETKAENEQAAAAHWMVGLYLKHGDTWREEGEKILKKVDPAQPSAPPAAEPAAEPQP
jgi:predicted  nucleic acid-binding Zn-ribbon protein